MTPGPQGHGFDSPGLGERRVLPFRIHHPRPAAEYRLTPQVRLHKGALAPTDLAEDDHVGIRQESASIELEGVVDEGTTEQVTSDEDAAPTEPGFGREGVGGTEMPGGGLVCGDAHEQKMVRSPCGTPCDGPPTLRRPMG